jgi:hypothetical protein
MIEITEGLRVEDVKVRRFLRTFTVFFPGDDAKFASANRAKAEVFGRLSAGKTTVASRITGVSHRVEGATRYVVSVETDFVPGRMDLECRAPDRLV